jgi:hypothetical protein
MKPFPFVSTNNFEPLGKTGMKTIVTMAAFGIILSFTYCTESSSNPKFIPGYISPGEFRPRGVAREKQYRLGIGGILNQSCGPASLPPADPGFPGGMECAAVYTQWLTPESDVYSEGIAVNDRNNPVPVFSMKLYHVLGFPLWYFSIIINGASYSGVIDSGAFSIVRGKSLDFSIPAYGTLTDSGVNINLATITFNKDVKSGNITLINAGDTIVVEDSSFFK